MRETGVQRERELGSWSAKEKPKLWPGQTWKHSHPQLYRSINLALDLDKITFNKIQSLAPCDTLLTMQLKIYYFFYAFSLHSEECFYLQISEFQSRFLVCLFLKRLQTLTTVGFQSMRELFSNIRGLSLLWKVESSFLLHQYSHRGMRVAPRMTWTLSSSKALTCREFHTHICD